MEWISIIGAGAWGTALAQTCAQNGRRVKLWVFEQHVFEAINDSRENSVYLPGIKLHKAISVVQDLEDIWGSNNNFFQIFLILGILYREKNHFSS